MKAAFLILLLLAACAGPADAPDTVNAPADDPPEHGTVPTTAPNLPSSDGGMELRSSMVAYHGDVEGYYTQPAAEGQYPGVVMIHEWWGLNDNIKAMADQLAGEGYRVLAVDLYEGTVASTPDEARQLTGGFNQTQGLENMRSAVSFLRAQGSDEIASLGWCFGGGQSLQLGLAEDLDATVIYYGSLVTDRELLAQLEQPVLGIFAELDQGIPPSKVQEFDAALDNLGVQNEVYIYPGVNHAFANPSGDRYAPEAAEDAWQKTVAFLATELD